jgi:all-trans-retinol 13,14-reductase
MPPRSLYLCGASVRTGHGILGVMMSGLFAAAAIVGPRLVPEVLRGTTLLDSP